MGLSALLGDSIEKEVLSEGRQIITINVNDILANKDQPRKSFKEESIKELAKSIEENGLMQPIIVSKSSNNKYLIIAGERRFRATKLIGKPTIEAIAIDVKTADEILHKALIENIQREDLSPIEEALAYKSIIEKTNITHQDLADKLGKSRSHISNMIRILTLPDEVLNLVNEGEISFGHAKLLVSTQDPVEYLEKIKNGMTVRDLESHISIEKRGSQKKQEKINKLNKKNITSEDDLDKDKLYTMIKEIYSGNILSPYVDHADCSDPEDSKLTENIKTLEEYITQRFNIKLGLHINRDKSGYIKIDYTDLDDLESIVDRLF